MTPRKPLPTAARLAVGDAMEAVQRAARLIRSARKQQTVTTPGDAMLAEALAELERAQRLLALARQGGVMAQTPRLPRIGDDVWYFASPQGGPLATIAAAKITAVDQPDDPDSSLALAVFAPPHTRYLFGVPRGKAPGCWDWPGKAES